MKTKTASKIEICPSHGELMKLLMDSQKTCAEQMVTIAYHAKTFESFTITQKEHGDKLGNIEKIVCNGLQSDIGEIKSGMAGVKTDLQGFMTDTRKKIAEFDEFSWFRKPMNKFRDSFLWKLIWLLFIVGAIITALHFDTIMNILTNGRIK